MTTSPVRAYTSNVFAVGPSIWCAIATIVVTVGVLSAAGIPVAMNVLVSFIIAVMVTVFVLMTAHVRVMATGGEVAYRVGLGRWRSFVGPAMRRSECVQVGAAAIIGIGIPPAWATARHILRSGPALHLEIDNGEHIWLSITGPLPADMTTGIASPINGRTHPR